MAWSIYADPMETADLTGVTKSIRFKPTANVIMNGCFTGLVFREVGTFSDLVVKLYSDRSEAPGALINTSTTSYDKADLLTAQDSGAKFFGFNFPSTSLNKNTYYHIVLNCTGYTFSEVSHMAWIKGWPKPVYNQPASYLGLITAAYTFGIMGAEF
jgi:hypothetical protein